MDLEKLQLAAPTWIKHIDTAVDFVDPGKKDTYHEGTLMANWIQIQKENEENKEPIRSV